MAEAEKEARIAPPVCLLHGLIPVILALLAESTLLWLWHIGALSLFMIAISHLLSSALPLVTVKDCGKEGLDERLAWLGSLMVFFLGPVGALGTIWASFRYAHYRKTAKPFDDWYRSILPVQDISRSERLIERLRAWGQESDEQGRATQSGLVPFNELINAGSRSDKQLAITMMSRQYNAAFAPAFKQALADDDNAVRVQAASAITRIEDQYQQAAMRVEQKAKKQPTLENLKAIAEHYDTHANAGLTDDDSIIELRHKAAESYRAVLNKVPNDYETLWGFGRLLVKQKDYVTAATTFENAFKQRDNIKVIERVWYWECLYLLKRYKDLRIQIERFFADLPEDARLPPSLMDTLTLWASQKPAEKAEQ